MTLTLALERVEFPPLGRVTDDTSILTLRGLVQEPLCRWRDGWIEPGLLAAWTHDATARDWRFAIRPGAAFHDGVPVTPRHVLDTIRQHCEGLDMFGMPWPYARYLDGAVIEQAGADAIRIATRRPFPDLPEVLAEFFCVRATPQGEALLGTGAYRVIHYDAKREARLESVDPARAPRQLRLVAEQDADTRHAMLRDGAADAATNLERMRGRIGAPGLDWHKAANTLSVMYYLDCTRPPFDQPAARLGVNLAVDAQAILDELFQGLGVLASSIVSPFHLGHAEAALSPIPHDPARARALLKDVREEILIRTPTHMPERAGEVSRMVADQLAASGVAARIEVEQDRPLYARQVAAKRIGQMAIFDSSPHSTFRVLDDKISATTRGLWWQGHDDAQLQPLIEAANRTPDHAARAQAYARCLRRLHENPPWLYLFHPVEVFAARPGTPGLALDHRGALQLRG
jgi:peptide/nickel transport system substrate-binding protein